MSKVAFDANALNRRYAFLDECPEALFPLVVTLPVGTIDERVIGVRSWHDALLAGHLPLQTCWPPAEIANPIRETIKSLGVLRFTKDQPALVEALMKDILSAFARHQDQFRAEVEGRVRELEALERQRLEAEESRRAKRKRQPPRAVSLDPESLILLQSQAEKDIAALIPSKDVALFDAWHERVVAWTSIADVFDDLGQMLGRGWDLAQEVLQHSGWLDVLRLRDLLEQLPQLRELIQTLGRFHFPEDGEPITETVFTPMCRLEEEFRQTRTPHIPAEMRGIQRSGEIARMLPTEASMLGHPQLRLLWHARRAERALMTYRVEGIEIERILVEREGMEEKHQKRPRPQRGPIISVIDTSGSMAGTRERVAKALILETLRTAHAEKRRCFVFSFSGTGNVVEHELALSPEGITKLLNFLCSSFGGGTDVGGVIEKVVPRLKQADWEKADVLVVSDGEWCAPPHVISSAREMRSQGVRFHGVLVGGNDKSAFDALCDPVHGFSEWASLDGDRGMAKR